MEDKVIHEEENERFVLYKDGREAYVEYTPEEDKLNLTHTHTDRDLRGQGLAAQVVRAAMEYIKEKNMKVIATCSYVQSFLEKNEEYKELVEE